MVENSEINNDYEKYIIEIEELRKDYIASQLSCDPRNNCLLAHFTFNEQINFEFGSSVFSEENGAIYGKKLIFSKPHKTSKIAPELEVSNILIISRL